MRTTLLAKMGRTMDDARGKRAESARPWPTIGNLSWSVGIYPLNARPAQVHEHIERLQAPRDRMLHVWFEPWAEGLAFPAGMVVELHSRSSLPGKLEFDTTVERTAVYGWPGGTLRVLVDGELIQSFDQAVPELLTRLSTKESISMLFGSPPVPTPQEGGKIRKSAWWRI